MYKCTIFLHRLTNSKYYIHKHLETWNGAKKHLKLTRCNILILNSYLNEVFYLICKEQFSCCFDYCFFALLHLEITYRMKIIEKDFKIASFNTLRKLEHTSFDKEAYQFIILFFLRKCLVSFL